MLWFQRAEVATLYCSKKCEQYMRARNGIKYCTKCRIKKPISEFYKCARKVDGLHHHCRECAWEYNVNRHGMTINQYDTVTSKQNGYCALCPVDLTMAINTSTACIDHDHQTGVVRGILCMACNLRLGLVEKHQEWYNRPDGLSDREYLRQATQNTDTFVVEATSRGLKWCPKRQRWYTDLPSVETSVLKLLQLTTFPLDKHEISRQLKIESRAARGALTRLISKGVIKNIMAHHGRGKYILIGVG